MATPQSDTDFWVLNCLFSGEGDSYLTFVSLLSIYISRTTPVFVWNCPQLGLARFPPYMTFGVQDTLGIKMGGSFHGGGDDLGGFLPGYHPGYNLGYNLRHYNGFWWCFFCCSLTGKNCPMPKNFFENASHNEGKARKIRKLLQSHCQCEWKLILSLTFILLRDLFFFAFFFCIWPQQHLAFIV